MKKLEKLEKMFFFFSKMGDKYTEISNKEQLSLCLQFGKEDLEVQEDFLGFYQLTNIKTETIVNVKKVPLLMFNLHLKNCRGKRYDNTSNMLGKKSGVATSITEEQPKAPAVHCYRHSLSLAVRQLTFLRKVLDNTRGKVGEICAVATFSSKRENLLGTIREQLEGEFFV